MAVDTTMEPVAPFDPEDAPEEVAIPAANLGLVIGRGGSTITMLTKATGCKIEVPKRAKGEEDAGDVMISLKGTPEQRRQAATAILDATKGGDPADYAARAQGALVIQHELGGFDKEAWCHWRLVPFEREHGCRVEMGRRAVKIWAAGRGKVLGGAQAELAKKAAEEAIAEARECVELIVEAKPEFCPEEHVRYDPAVFPLIYSHGVLVHVPRPLEGRVPVKIVGPPKVAKDAADMLEARFIKGKSTASVLQAPGQVQNMDESMLAEFQGDLEALQQEHKVKVHVGEAVLWISGTNDEGVANARGMLMEMLVFYYPELFYKMVGIRKNKELFSKIRGDIDLLVLASAPMGLALDSGDGSAWICGKVRDPLVNRIRKIEKEWNDYHFEMELADYGACMWLLGPKGTGDFLCRMQADCGAKMKVCPQTLRVIVEGEPHQIKEAEKLIKDALKKLEAKKRHEEENGIQVKVREIQSDHTPHMSDVLSRLAKLDALKTAKKIAEKREELKKWEDEFRPAGDAPAAGAGGAGAGGGGGAGGSGGADDDAGGGGGRDRSRSRGRAGQRPQEEREHGQTVTRETIVD